MTEVAKRDYNAIRGETHSDVNAGLRANDVIAQQPSGATGVESYVLNLDASQVATWSPEDVINNFVERIGLGYMNEPFIANKINGRALMMLTESHLKEMGIQAIGDRVYLQEMICLLKKKKRELETTASLWTGETPAPGIAYSNDCGHCCVRYCCPCCISRTYWKVTGQGVFYRKVPPCRDYFGTVSTEYMDYRFFKDLELKERRLFCCCCERLELEIFVDDKDNKAASRSENAETFPTPHILVHPEAARAEQIIRNAWSQARLVAE